MAMQFYASPEQIMRDRSEYARKNIARGRNVVVLSYADGVLFLAENLSKALHKVSEIYDRIGFAAVGRYNEFENLRAAGVRMADLRGYSYDRRDVTGRAIATAFAQTLGSIFTVETKPYEVEICIAEVGATPANDELYRITYDGQAQEEPGFLAMGGSTDVLTKMIRERHSVEMSLTDAVRLGVDAIYSVGGENGKPRPVEPNQLEVAVLDRARPGRKFRRITGAALTPLLGPSKTAEPAAADPDAPTTAADKAATDKAATDKPAAGKPPETKPSESKAAETKPAADKPAADKPGADKPSGRSANGKPAADKPGNGKPTGETSDGGSAGDSGDTTA